MRLNDLAAEESERANGNGAAPAAGEAAPEGDAPTYIARAHHGSLAREERLIVEDLLKSGELPCLVATSSLELGIDMGAVDLVIQVESPKSVTAGLQRIGRAGHGVGEVSRGRIFPKFRADLLECAVVARRMRDGDIEPTVVPRNPLDVLAQQIVAMSASGDEELKVPALHETIKRAYPFAELSRELLDSVLDMLDGRYPSEEFAELRPRIVWDRVEDTIRARRGALQLAVTNAGTIPDRGLYGVHLPDGRRVGELDEEMVYEARPGQTFLLGASTWRIEEITRDRVIVTPAPGRPGRSAVLEGRRHRPAEGARPCDRRLRPRIRGPRPRRARGRVRPRRARGQQPVRVPARAARRHARGPERPHHRGRALPRRDRRLAPLRPVPVRRARAFGMGPGPLGSHPGRVRPRVRRHLVGRRHHRPPARRGRAALRRSADDRAGRDRGHGGGRAVELRPLRRALPRERRPRAAAAARLPREAHAAVAAAPEGAVAARGGEALRPVPDHSRDLSRVPPGRARPPRPRAAPARPSHARAVARGGGDPARLPVRIVAALRLRGHLHVRGRHAQRRAARRGTVARPRPAAGAARAGGAARADRPERAGRGGGRPPADERAHARRQLRRPARRAARGGRPDRRRGPGALPARRGRGSDTGRAGEGPARDPDEDRRRGALDRLRGRRSLPRCPGRGAARRPPRRVPRGRQGPPAPARPALCPHPRPVHHARDVGPLRRSTSGRCCASSSVPAT